MYVFVAAAALLVMGAGVVCTMLLAGSSRAERAIGVLILVGAAAYALAVTWAASGG